MACSTRNVIRTVATSLASFCAACTDRPCRRRCSRSFGSTGAGWKSQAVGGWPASLARRPAMKAEPAPAQGTAERGAAWHSLVSNETRWDGECGNHRGQEKGEDVSAVTASCDQRTRGRPLPGERKLDSFDGIELSCARLDSRALPQCSRCPLHERDATLLLAGCGPGLTGALPSTSAGR